MPYTGLCANSQSPADDASLEGSRKFRKWDLAEGSWLLEAGLEHFVSSSLSFPSPFFLNHRDVNCLVHTCLLQWTNLSKTVIKMSPLSVVPTRYFVAAWKSLEMSTRSEISNTIPVSLEDRDDECIYLTGLPLLSVLGWNRWLMVPREPGSLAKWGPVK